MMEMSFQFIIMNNIEFHVPPFMQLNSIVFEISDSGRFSQILEGAGIVSGPSDSSKNISKCRRAWNDEESIPTGV